MIHYIENEELKIGVKDFGCELTSVFSKKISYEYLWQGDEKIWYGQSPILFPIVGRLIDDRYTLDGVEYNMPKHGFARKSEWKFLGTTDNSMSFLLTQNEETLKIYPYNFELTVTFSIDGKKLKATHSVKNLNNKTMYFSIGAHPGFNCAIGDKLTFSEKETLSSEKIDLEKSLRLPESFELLNNEDEIVISEHIFDEDALILKGVKSEYITLSSAAHNRRIKFNIGHAPYLGIWAKPNAPYVCIEPWFGVNDSTVKKRDFSEKDEIISLSEMSEFSFSWEAEFSH